MSSPQTVATESRSRRVLFGLITVLLPVGFTLGITEIGLRLFWGGYYEKDVPPYSDRRHATRGWANLPNVHTTYGEPEFQNFVVHDSRGFRSQEVADHKSDDRIRILVLGDSFAWGVGVENDETFSAVLERLDPRFEVINTGTNGYGTSQQLRLLEEEGLALDPDIVIVAFFWNDVANSYKRTPPAYALEGDALRYTPPAPAVSALAKPERRPKLRRRLGRVASRTYTYRLVSDRGKILRYRVKHALGVPLEETEFVGDEEREEAWRLELALLREIDRVSRDSGASTLIAIIPDQVQIQTDMQVLGLDEDDYAVQERLLEFGARSGIAVLDLLPALRTAYQTDGVPLYYRWDRHLNRLGHERVAREILREIEATDAATRLAN